MKKSIISAIAALCCIICNAQSETIQLEVQDITYNGTVLPRDEWPCENIYKNPNVFVFGYNYFKVLSSQTNNTPLSSSYTVEIKGKTGSSTEVLTYDQRGKDVYIHFIGYSFKCTTLRDGNYPFALIDQKPSFNGGDANAFSRWVAERLNYPEAARKDGIQGRVTISFTVNKKGVLTDVSVLHGVHPDLDAEAVRVVSMSPKWKPGKLNGKKVSVTYTFPVIFQLK